MIMWVGGQNQYIGTVVKVSGNIDIIHHSAFFPPRGHKEGTTL